MKRSLVTKAVLLVVLALAAVTLLPSAYAQQCSLARTAGTYGVSDTGTVAGIGPRAVVGLITFDHAGNASAVVTANLNGSVSQTTLTGTYTVNPDCTGTTSFSEFDQSGQLVLTVTAVQVWDAQMREFRFLFTSVVLANGTPLQTVISGSARKLEG